MAEHHGPPVGVDDCHASAARNLTVVTTAGRPGPAQPPPTGRSTLLVIEDGHTGVFTRESVSSRR